MAKKTKELKRVKNKEFFNYKKRRGDRTDGWRIRSATDPTFDLIPHIMPMRCDSQVFLEDTLETEVLDNFVRKMRREGDMPELSRLAVVMAACVRAFSRYPKTNRFIAGKKIYARNHYCISLTIKKSMDINSDEANLKIYLNPNATLRDVYEELNKQISASKNDVDNSTDSFVDKITSVPQWAIRAFMRWANRKDARRGLPKFFTEISPFHTSLYITDIGSTGINSVFHHIYNFGTTSAFLSIGKRERKLVLDDDGNPKYVKCMKFCYVIDERICDGFYYAKSLRFVNHLLAHPEELLDPPEVINEDPLC